MCSHPRDSVFVVGFRNKCTNPPDEMVPGKVPSATLPRILYEQWDCARDHLGYPVIELTVFSSSFHIQNETLDLPRLLAQTCIAA